MTAKPPRHSDHQLAEIGGGLNVSGRANRNTARYLPSAAAVVLFGLLAAFAVTMTPVFDPEPPRSQEAVPSVRAGNIERGRRMMRSGNVFEAEAILWREYLAAEAAAATDAGPSPAALPANPSHWALWELYARSPCRATARLHEGVVSTLAIRDDGTVVTAGEDGILTQWSPDTGAAPRLRIGPAGTNIVVSGDGRRVARWNIDYLEMFDIATRDWIGKVEAYRMDRPHLSVSRTGRHVVGAADRFVSLWTAEGNHVREIQIQRAPRRVHAAAAGNEGARAVTAEDDVVKFFRVGAMREVAIARLGARPSQLAVSSDGRRAAAVAGTVVYVFDAEDGREIDVEPHTDIVTAVSFAPDGRVIATGGWSRRVRVWEPDHLEGIVTEGIGHASAVTAVAVGPAARLVASGDDTGVVKLWEREPGGSVTRVATPGVSNHAVRVAPGGDAIASCGARGEASGAIEVRDASTGDVRVRWEEDTVVADLAWLPDRARLVTCAFDGTVQLRDVAGGPPRTLITGAERLRCVAVSPDGRSVAAGSDESGDLRLAAVDGNAAPLRLRHHRLRVSAVAFSPDGSRLASASDDGTVALWDVRSGTLVRVLEGHAGPVRAVRFHPEGALLATGGDDRSVRMWDIASGEAIAVLTGHEQGVLDVAFSPDGTLLASGDRAGVIRLWGAAGGAELAILEQLDDAGSVTALQFAPDGRSLVSATTESMFARWDLTYYDRFMAGNRAYWTTQHAVE